MTFDICADADFPFSTLKRLDEFRQTGICVDTKLIAGDEDSIGKNYLWCHKCVVAASSPFFRGLFSAEMKEKSENSATLHGFSLRILQMLLDFIYSGRARLLSDVEGIQLLTAAGFLAMDDLITACANWLKSKITVTNCLTIEKAADAANCHWLASSAREFALANFEGVCRTSEFLDLDYNRLLWYVQNYAESVAGVGSDHVLDGCDTVYRALGKWTVHQGSEILGHSSSSSSLNAEENSIVEKCKTCLIPEKCSCAHAGETNCEAHVFTTVQNLFAQLLSFSVIDTNPPLTDSLVNVNNTNCIVKNQRNSTQQIGVIIVACGRSPRIWAFSQKRNSWLALPNLPYPIRKAGLCALAGSLYVVGGIANGMPSNEVWRLDVLPASWHLIRQPVDSRPVARWIAVEPLPEQRAGHAVAAIGDRFLCVLGGYGINQNLAESILCYDRIKNKWIEVGKSASVPRIGARLAVIANYNNDSSRHSSSSSTTGDCKCSATPLPSSWTLLEVGGLQAGGRLAVIDCYSATYETAPNVQNLHLNQQSNESLMPDDIKISFSGEQLLLPQAVRFAEPVMLTSGYESFSNRYGDHSSRLLVVCSDYGSQTLPSPGADFGHCFVLSFDLHRRICHVVSPNLPSGNRIRPAVARSSDGASAFIVGGRMFDTSQQPPFSLQEGEDEEEASNSFRPVPIAEMFTAETREWIRVSDMPQARSGHCSALLLFVNY